MAERERYVADIFDEDGTFIVFDREDAGMEADGPFPSIEAAEANAKWRNELVAERNELWAQLQAAGGRGVDLAERIDAIDKSLAQRDHDRQREFVLELLEGHQNDWGGGDSIDEILDSKYAVVVDRDDDGWVVGADSDEDIAAIKLGCLDGEYTEWIDAVYDLATLELYEYDSTIEVWVNGVVATDRVATSEPDQFSCVTLSISEDGEAIYVYTANSLEAGNFIGWMAEQAGVTATIETTRRLPRTIGDRGEANPKGA